MFKPAVSRYVWPRQKEPMPCAFCASLAATLDLTTVVKTRFYSDHVLSKALHRCKLSIVVSLELQP